MMHRDEVAAYAYRDFWSGKPRAVRWFYKLLSHLIVPLSVCVFNNASFGCINNLQVGHGNDTLCTELRFRGEDGEHSGSFMPVDFAKIAEGYGCKAFTIHSIPELKTAIREAKKIKDVPVVFDIRVLPKSMTEGYGSWWRVGDTEVSELDMFAQS